MTMKELPSPPTGDYDTAGVRASVMGSEPQTWSQSPPPTSSSALSGEGSSSGHGEMESLIVNPVIPPSPPTGSSLRTHSRADSSYSRNYSFPAPPSGPPTATSAAEPFAAFEWAGKEEEVEVPPEVPTKSKGREKKRDKGKKVLGIEDGGALEGRPPPQMSKTQREKERKKRGKARIVTEHVDIIGDGFWERRPWILSGRAG